MRKTVTGWILCWLCVSVQAYVPVDEAGDWERSLNGQWQFKLNEADADSFFQPGYDVSAWSSIQVPGNWELQGFEPPRYKEPGDAVGLYRREFEVPAAWAERRVFLRFEGVLYGFEFWINGTHAGRFESAFNRSEFDVTDLIDWDNANVLAVRVYRRFKGWQFDTFDGWGLSGIYRDVSLFSVGQEYIRDLTVVTEVAPEGSKASVQYKVVVAQSFETPSDFTLAGTLTDPGGDTVWHCQSRVRVRDQAGQEVDITLDVNDPVLWTAETPHLYDLRLDLRSGERRVHAVTRKVGIRQVTIDGDVFKLNHRPIKLRGVNHHDIHPDVGRALREAHYRQDIELMKKGNINAVRTSHYPPHPMFLDLCDEYGLYVICEVPFGFGDKHLTDPSYRDVLLARADATVARDKNHASVLIWSIGNENPITPIVIDTANRVKKLDPTRFRLLPGAQDSQGRAPAKGANLTEFAEKTKFIFDLPDSVEIAAPHYPYVREVPERDRKINLTDLAFDPSIQRPVICTEYNHSLSSAFEGLKDHWEMIESHGRLGGAFIWNWADQGLKRNLSDARILLFPKDRLSVTRKDSRVCADVWLDSETVLDSRGGAGTDGIVYADRFPQVDYWITRKVYSQVVIPVDTYVVRPGKQTVELDVLNRYDFINLDRLEGRWRLLCHGQPIQSGDISMSVPPRGKGKIAVEVDLEADLEETEHVLELVFCDPFGHQVYERSVHLVPTQRKVSFARRVSAGISSHNVRRLNWREPGKYQIGRVEVHVDQVKGKIEVYKSRPKTLLLSGPMIRVGRRPVMAEWRNYPRYDVNFWEHAILKDCRVLECSTPVDTYRGVKFEMSLDFPSLDEGRDNESIQADFKFYITPRGEMDVTYELTPKNATGNFLDFGLAFELPKTMGRLLWIGDGPYSSYPGQTEANERGVWRIIPRPVTDPESRLYDGNRSGVDLALVSNGEGGVVGVVCDGSTLSLEPREGSMFLSQVLRSSGKGNKTGGMMTLLPVKASEIKSETGWLRLVMQDTGSQVFKDLFGLKSNRGRPLGRSPRLRIDVP